jgi:hypothetical protein
MPLLYLFLALYSASAYYVPGTYPQEFLKDAVVSGKFSLSGEHVVRSFCSVVWSFHAQVTAHVAPFMLLL